ncbi:MAG TPA: hypothetical protein VGL57_06380 [Solirubrobacteraceae bacterium]
MGAHSATASAPRAPEHGAGEDRARRRAAAGYLPWGLLAAVVGVAVWLLVDPRTPDLAAQVYRADLFGEAGWTVWDARWYGGHDIPGYSLVFPPLAALLGVRTVGALAVLVSAALFERLARVAYGAAARWGAVWFALAALGDVWSGRITFALGVSFALAAVAALALSRARVAPVATVALAALSAACSPVAGALLVLAGVTHSLARRSWRSAALLGIAPALVIAVLVGCFAEGGWEPYPLLSFLATGAALGGFLIAVLALAPAEGGLLRLGAAVYLAVCVACVALHTPMGANVERYGVLLAGPLLLCALLDSGSRGAAAVVASAALLGIGLWTVWGPVRETAAVAGEASTSAAYYAPVERFVAGHGGSRVRIEVPFTRGHWEAAWLARRVSLARGWEKQLDERYDGVLLSGRLTAERYYRWLREQAVSYVALPDAPLDPSSADEGRVIESDPGYLREVLRTRHWRIYAVRDATPLASGPGALSALGRDWFTLRARTGGRFVVRVHYTRYWTVTAGAACVTSAPGGWTAVSARAAGTVRVAARFSLGRALGLGGQSCT